MGKRIISFLVSFALVTSISVPSFANENNIEEIEKVIQTEECLESIAAEDVKIKDEDGQIFISGELSEKLVPGENSASSFLEDNKAFFDIENVNSDLQVLEVITDEIGDTFVKYGQVIDGIQVKDSYINVHFNKEGTILSVNGKIEKNKNITNLGNEYI
ncbi:hypothetical protein [Clostridium isatidis]|uniref:hypothetical protein n=1 Tax=Clostridium isatidis TaxID=182773 RepID=UPI003AAE8FF4